MKHLIVLVLGGGLCLSAAGPLQVTEVQKVYLMPMAGGLDQYLAERLTREGVFTVVVDPKQADAVWSERVDPGFAGALDELYPPPKPEEAKEEAAAEVEKPPFRRAMGRARGNVFLVGVASRQILWSTFLRVEDTSPRGLHRAARDIVKVLKKDLKKE